MSVLYRPIFVRKLEVSVALRNNGYENNLLQANVKQKGNTICEKSAFLSKVLITNEMEVFVPFYIIKKIRSFSCSYSSMEIFYY